MATAVSGTTFVQGWHCEKKWNPETGSPPELFEEFWSPQKGFLSGLHARYIYAPDKRLKKMGKRVRENMGSPSFHLGRASRRTAIHASAFPLHTFSWITAFLILAKLRAVPLATALAFGASIGWLGTWPGKKLVHKIEKRWWNKGRLEGVRKGVCVPLDASVGQVRKGLNYTFLVPVALAGLAVVLLQRGDLLTQSQRVWLSAGLAVTTGGVGGHYLSHEL